MNVSITKSSWRGDACILITSIIYMHCSSKGRRDWQRVENDQIHKVLQEHHGIWRNIPSPLILPGCMMRTGQRCHLRLAMGLKCGDAEAFFMLRGLSLTYSERDRIRYIVERDHTAVWMMDLSWDKTWGK